MILGRIYGANTLHERYKSGNFIPHFLNKNHKQETKDKISEKLKNYKNHQKYNYKCINHNTNETFKTTAIGKFVKEKKLHKSLTTNFNLGRPYVLCDFKTNRISVLNSIGWEIITENVK